VGFIEPSPPSFVIDEWKTRPYLARLKANCQEWAVSGFGAPGIVYLLYVVKLILFVVGAFFVISITTPGIGTLGDIGDWWSKPIVFQKFAAWTLVWEILGFGSGSMQLAARYGPIIGGCLYWLRPRTVRLPPWPDKVPLTRGNERTVLDVLLYAGVVAAGIHLLVSNGVDGSARLDPAWIAPLLGLWALLGLRDKVPFLAGRPEVYGFMMLISLFPPPAQMIVGWQFVFLFIWWGAAASKLNRHFPFVIAVMVSNTPWNRSKTAKSRLYKRYPDDLRPGRPAELGAHLGTAVEFGVPLVLILSSGGPIGTLAVIVMILFHLHITSTFALGVPQEWNLFMIWGIPFLFAEHGELPLSSLDNPLLIAILILVGVVIPVLGNLFPEKISFLPGMRYYAGNWGTSTWLFNKESGAEEKLDERIYKPARITVEQLGKVYGREMADFFMEKVLAFRALHSHGRALNALAARAVDEIDSYRIRDGEVVSGVVNGWNFGDGHFHNKQLLDVVQEKCAYEEGELRVVVLEGQPAHVQRQHYWVYDAATGLIEEGWVDVAEMCKRGPWLEESFEFPVETVHSRTAAA
jgi:hypothetical protein